MNELLTYIKEQFEIDNFGRVIRNAEKLLQDSNAEHPLELYMYKAYAELNQFLDLQAIDTFNMAIGKFPEEFEPRLQKSLAQINIGEFLEARNELSDLDKMFPQNLEVLNNLIYIAEMLKSPKEVIRLSDHILSFSQEDYSILLTKASAYQDLGNYDEAVKLIKQGLEFDDLDEIDLAMGYNDLGYAYSRMKKYKIAKEYLETALENDNDPITLNNLGWVMANLNQVEDGLKLVNHSLSLDGRNSYAYKNRAKIYLMLQQNNKAIADLRRAKELDYEVEYDQEVNELLAKFITS